MVARLGQTNLALIRFKGVGRITLSVPNRPDRSFRAAMAGQLSDRLRIDMFAPFGGSAGTVSSDGKHLFLVMHPTRKYYKRRYGNGSLRRMIQIDVTVEDLLELLVGRIPMETGLLPKLSPDEKASRRNLVLVDRWGRTRQIVTVDDAMNPLAAVWLDSDENPIYTLTRTGTQAIDGFVLPRRIELSGASGERVSVTLDRYEANTRLDENLFSPAAPSS